MEEFHVKPLSARKSQHLGPVDFIKENAWAYLPLASVIAGVGIGAATKHKFFPFNGHLPITMQAQEWAWKKLFSKGGVELGEITNANRMWNLLSEERADKIAPHVWNGIKAAEFAGIPFLYLLWRKKEGQQLDLQDVSQNMLALPKDIKPTDAELAEENVSLAQQLEFVRARNGTPSTHLQAATVEPQGRMEEPSQRKMR